MTLIDPAGDPVAAFRAAPDRHTEIALIRAYCAEVLAYRAAIGAAQNLVAALTPMAFMLCNERAALDQLRAELAALPTLTPSDYDGLVNEVRRLTMLLEQARDEADVGTGARTGI